MMHISHDIEYKMDISRIGNDYLRWLCPGVEGYYKPATTEFNRWLICRVEQRSLSHGETISILRSLTTIASKPTQIPTPSPSVSTAIQ